MSKKFRLLMVLVLATGLLGGLMTASTVSADPVPDVIVEIPRIDLGDVFGTGDWDTKIQVQNVGDVDGGVVAIFWGGWSAECPSNDPGPIGHACMQLPYNGVWTLHMQIPDGAESAILYSVAAEDLEDACGDAPPEATGPPIAVTVDRWGPDSYGEYEISSSYTGVSEEMVGPGPPYKYFAPYVMHGYNDLDTTITIQNSGDLGTSCWVYYKEEGNCEQMKAQHLECIAPGESIRIGPGVDADVNFPTPELAAPWLGSAYITCNEPMAIVVDQLSHSPSANRATLLSMRGIPYKKHEWGEEWDTVWYADLLYREISGYSSSIQVQNLTQDSMPTFVTVDFFDQSGDEILFVGDWVCRNGSATFYLPAIVDLGINFPFGYVGAAEIQSHWQVDYPGDWHEGEPIFAVVDIKKDKVWDGSIWRHTNPGETQGGAYNAHPWQEKENAWGWAMPYIAKEQDGVTSRIAIRNNSNCNKIDGWIYIKDETGTIVAGIPVPYLHPKHMKVIDLAYFSLIPRGFVGAAEFWVESIEQLCDTDGDGSTDAEPVMPSVVVLNYGYEKELPIGGGAGPQTTEGDLTRVYEGIPFFYQGSPCTGKVWGTVTDELTSDPVQDAEVCTNDGTNCTLTDSTGNYQLDGVWCGENVVCVAKEGYLEEDCVGIDLSAGEIANVNFELYPECDTVRVEGFVEDKMTGEPINGATVQAENCVDSGVDTTDADGYYEIELPYDDECTTWVWAFKEADDILEYNLSADSVFIPICDTAWVDFQLHQTPDSRVLLYYGNGGVGPDTEPGDLTNYYTLANFFEEEFGLIVDYTDVWPTEFDWTLKYKLIVLLAPGHDSGENLAVDGFTIGQKADLDRYLEQGGTLVVLSDNTAFTGQAVENDLLNALPVELQFNSNSWADGLGNQITADCLTTNVAVFDTDAWTDLAPGAGAAPGALILQNTSSVQCPDCPMYAADIPSHGNGIVIIAGDLNFVDDIRLLTDFDWPADNEWIPFNWIACDP